MNSSALPVEFFRVGNYPLWSRDPDSDLASDRACRRVGFMWTRRAGDRWKDLCGGRCTGRIGGTDAGGRPRGFDTYDCCHRVPLMRRFGHQLTPPRRSATHATTDDGFRSRQCELTSPVRSVPADSEGMRSPGQNSQPGDRDAPEPLGEGGFAGLCLPVAYLRHRDWRVGQPIHS